MFIYNGTISKVSQFLTVSGFYILYIQHSLQVSTYQIYIIKIENTKLQHVVHLTTETKKNHTGFLVTLARENRTIGSLIGKTANTCAVTLLTEKKFSLVP
jgi:hypothetical protein